MPHVPPIFMLLVLAVLSPTISARDTHPFPMQRVADRGADGIELELVPARFEALRPLTDVLLTDVPLPGGASVSLELRRVQVVSPDIEVFVDGVHRPGVDPGRWISMWSGRIDGMSDSDVYLAFAPTGSRGWVREGDRLHHLVTAPGAANDGLRSRFVTDGRLRETGWTPELNCGVTTDSGAGGPFTISDATTRALPDRSAVDGSIIAGTQAFLPLLECRVAIETDTQYAQVFGGNVAAAQDFLVMLFGAVSSRYREQVGIVLTLVYTAFYTGPDPWITQETTNDGYDLIFEFIDAWEAGQAPVQADIFHLHSGSTAFPSLGAFGGVCSPDFGFSTAVNMDGLVPFPIAQGPLNWPFIVMAHEMGHNFHANHTHDYCPPIDQCSASFGQCQTQQICQTNGTIMSYCVQCSGGAANYTTYFHPFIIDIIRAYAENQTCLQPFNGLFSQDLGFALAGGGGTTQMDASFTQPNTVSFDYGNAPTGLLGYVVAGLGPIFAPFQGGIFVPSPTLLKPFTAPASSFSLAFGIPDTFPSGIDIWLQTWFVDATGPFGYSGSNAIEIELIISDPWPTPVWVAHPGNGKEYALSSPGTYASALAEAGSLGGQLATVDSQALADWVVSTFQDPVNLFSIYIGLTDEASEGAFAWETGTPLAYTNWGNNQPNDDSASGQDFVELRMVSGALAHEDDVVLAASEWNDTLGTGWLLNRALMERPAGP